MSTWNQQHLHKHMQVYSSDKQELGQVAAVYEDSFQVHEGHLFPKSRYFPYEQIEAIDTTGIHLRLSADEARQMMWEKRPDYEHHLGDPTQLFYDRGHGIPDPFEGSNSDKA